MSPKFETRRRETGRGKGPRVPEGDAPFWIWLDRRNPVLLRIPGDAAFPVRNLACQAARLRRFAHRGKRRRRVRSEPRASPLPAKQAVSNRKLNARKIGRRSVPAINGRLSSGQASCFLYRPACFAGKRSRAALTADSPARPRFGQVTSNREWETVPAAGWPRRRPGWCGRWSPPVSGR